MCSRSLEITEAKGLEIFQAALDSATYSLGTYSTARFASLAGKVHELAYQLPMTVKQCQ